MPSRHWSEKHPDPVGTGIIQEYGTGGGYVYDQVAPTVRVNSQSFQYGTREFGPHIAQYNSGVMAPNGPMNQVRAPGVTYTDAVTQRYGAKDSIGAHEARESQNPAADEGDMWFFLMQQRRLAIEAELKTALDAASNATTLTGTAQWNNASALIEKSIDDAVAAFALQCGFSPTHIIVPEACWLVFKRDSTLRDANKYTHGNILDGNGGYTTNTFSLQFVVPGAIKNTANESATPVVAQLWADDKVYLMYVDPTVRSSKTAFTGAWFASQMNEVNQQFMASAWDDERGDVDLRWYGVSEWHKLITESALIHRLDDVLA